MTSTPTHGAPAGRQSGAGRPTATPLSRAMDTIKKLRAELEEAKAQPADDAGPLAVVGAGLRLPGGIADLDGYWDALAQGRDLVRPMPEQRKEPFTDAWDGLPHRGGHLDDVLGFDAAFFGISPREARSLDPQHRLLLEVAWEALEDAALPPRTLAEDGRRTGLYVGVTGQDYRDWQPAGQEDAYWLTGNGHCFAAGRIAYTLGLMGPAVAVDTACSSSLTAVHLAGRALRHGECDVALAGGVNLILSPRSTRLIQQTNSLAPDGLCKTFDARANGFTRGEGCGVVVLKRLADARRDGDRIHAVVRGSAVNQDGRSSGFTAPNVRAQIALIRAALEDAGLGPETIGAIEAHGTGTALGDPIEVEAIVAALDRSASGAPLRIGSVKTGLGHLEAASGIAGLIRGVLSVKRRMLPPVVHLRTLNPRIRLDGTGIEIPREVVPWETGDSGPGSCLGVSSFGMSGTNAHVVLGAPTEAERPAAVPAAGPVTGFELSARTEDALRAWAGLLAGRLAELSDGEYGAFAYTVTHGRARHGMRALVTAQDARAALTALRELAAGGAPERVRLFETTQDAPPDPAVAALPRAVADLPAYPWERVRYAPAVTAGSPLGAGPGTDGREPPSTAPAATATQTATPGRNAAPTGTGHATPAPATAGEATDGGQAVLPALRVAWEPHTPPAPSPTAADDATRRPLLVAGDDTGLVALLARAARDAGGRAVQVLDTLPGTDADWAEVRAAHPGDLLLALAAAPLPAAPDEPAPTGHAAALAAAATGAVRAVPEGPGRVHLVTAGVRQVTGNDAIADGDHGVLHGLAPVLALEYPRAWGGIVDLPVGAGPEDASAALAALAAGDTEDLLAVRSGRVHAARLRAVEQVPEPLSVRSDGTYLVSGGLGAIGRVIARDLAARGAGHLVLLGRRAEEELPAEAADLPASLAAAGTPVTYLRADVGDGPALAEALRVLDALPPLRGVVHTAGVIERLPLADAGREAFAAALHGKFTGAHWLRLLTDDRPLDFFVQLSSVSAVWGTSGYGAYAAANGALDSVAERAAASGRPARSIAFGPWDLDGMADSDARAQLARMGVRPVSPALGSAALTVAGPHGAHLVACDLDTDRFTAVMNAVRPRALFDPQAPSPAPAAAAEPRDALRAAPGHRRPALVAGHVRAVLAEILGHDDPAALPERTGFLDLGLDSIMAVDAAARLTEVLGLDVGIGDVFGHPSLERLSAELTERLSATHTGTDASAGTTDASAGATPAPRRAPAVRVARAATTAATTVPGTGTAATRGTGSAAPAPEPVAIVGMAGRFPGADSVEEFWSLLAEGRDGVGPVPADRWDAEGLGTPAQGGFLSDIRRFDAAFFDIPAREAQSLDPQQRLLLEASWHALEDAACAPTALAGSRTGVFVGISNSDYARVMESGGADALDAYFPTGTALNAAAGRISYYLGLHGPALAVDTACSSSLVALHLAVRSLRSGESDRALAGGVNVITAPTCSVAVSRAHMLSPQGRCRTFDAAADGFVRAEGVGVLVLRRLSDALRDGDRVLAVVHGSAVNQDGASSGFTAPNGTAQRRVIREALADAGVEGADIGYLEAHGTGTSLGDPIEVEAAWDVLGPGRRAGEPLLIGSVKSNIGHCESASGMASLVKTVLALRHGRVPGGLHFTTPNPHVPWRDMNVRVVDGRVSWAPGDRPRLAGVSGFGFSGTNAHVVLGEAPADRPTPPADPEPAPLLLPLSAPDAAGLERVTAAWESALEHTDEELLPDLVSVAAAGRAHLPVRRAVLGTGREKLLTALRSAGAGDASPARTPKVAFLFSGQGAQYFGMGRELYESEPVFASVIDDCDRVLTPHLGDSLLNLVFYGDDPQAVNQTRITQPALVALELALAALWESWGVRATAVMGHSVGEVAAAVHAGVLGREDGLTLIAHRARLMQSTEPGGMLSVPGAPATVATWAEEAGVDVAAVNGPESVVVAGPRDRLDALAARLTDQGVRTRALTVSHAFHSRLMDPVLAEFEAAVAPLAFGPPRIPVIANVTGAEAADDTYDAGYFVRHIRQPVRFHEGARALTELGVDVLLEVGPDRTLVNLVRAAGLTPAGGGVPSLRRGGVDRTQLLGAARHLYERGQDLDFARITGRPAGRAAAPRYPFADTSYWTSAASTTSTTSPASVTTATTGGAPRPGHGRHWGAELKSPALSGRAFSFARSAEFPAYLTDHRLYGTVVTPAASHLGTVLSALGGDGSPVLVRDLICPRALVIKDGEEYEVQITVDRAGSDGTAELSVQSLVDPERGIWQRHIGGRCATPPAERTHRPRPDDRAAFTAAADRHLTRDDFYAYFRALGYTLGPSFRWIDEVWIQGDRALVRYRMPELPDDPADYELYPGLIDSCFQSIAVFLVDENPAEAASLAIPFAARELSFHGRPAEDGELWGEVRVLRAEPLANDRLRVETADLHLYAVDPATGAEHSVFRADEFRIRHASRAVLEAGLRGDGLVRALDWVPLPQDAAASLTAPVPVTLLGDATGADSNAAALVAALEAAGHQVSVHEGLPGRADLGDVGNLGDAGLVVDARWLAPRGFADRADGAVGGAGAAAAPDARDALDAVRRLAATLRALPPELPYVLLADGDAVRAPLRESLFGLLSSLEAEQTERRLTRLRLDAGWRAEGVAALLGALPEETRLAYTDSGVRVARLVDVADRPAGPERAGGALITGGLGALGLAVAGAHAARGGDRVTLMARSAPGAVEQGAIDSLTAAGVRVSLVRGDVTDPADVARAVAAATADGPLGTVYHLAGVNADGAFPSLTDASYEKVFHAKALGADVLADAVAGHHPRAVVLFSSVSSVLGSAGQANYAAANGYLDGLSEALRERGLTAVTVNWGPWVPEAKGGMAAAAAVERAAQRVGIRPLSDADAALPLALAAEGAQDRLVVAALDPARYAEQAAGHPRAALVAALTGPVTAPRSARDEAEPAGWLRDRLAACGAGADADAEHVLRGAVRALVARMLGSDDGLPEDGSADAEGFSHLGLDSIMAIDLRAALAHAMGRDLPATIAIDHPSVLAMSGFLAADTARTGPGTPASASGPLPALAPAAAAVAPDHSVPSLPSPDSLPAAGSLEDLSLDELLRAVTDDLAQEQ
ncbi:SDR family NAD(P)-dependent oxidoreductase [Streptomyces sp. NPDC018026]|uniref:SDR family NAD(P)-dependent oxidoreductase n=1 Tax=Streptomyces sp. NPDC018026 TaxID=3365031 RepID=UPI00379040B9